MRCTASCLFATLLALICTGLITIRLSQPLFYGHPDSIQNHLISETLKAGEILTIVHPLAPGGTSQAREGFKYGKLVRSGFIIIQWQLTHGAVSDATELRFGTLTEDGQDLTCRINLTSTVNLPPQFLDQPCSFYAKAGSPVALFNTADAVLLDQRVSSTWRDVDLNVLIPQRGILELWKRLPDWSTYNESDISLIDDNDRDQYRLASFNASVPQLANIEVNFQHATVQTLPQFLTDVLANAQIAISWTLDALIYPGIVLVANTLMYTAGFGLIYFFIAYIVWSRAGTKRPFSVWARSHWMTKNVARPLLGTDRPKTWGVSGPLDDTDDDQVLHKRPPRSLSNPLQFFRSSSPLDDLLYTFTATRWMVKPIGQGSSADDELAHRK